MYSQLTVGLLEFISHEIRELPPVPAIQDSILGLWQKSPGVTWEIPEPVPSRVRQIPGHCLALVLHDPVVRLGNCFASAHIFIQLVLFRVYPSVVPSHN